MTPVGRTVALLLCLLQLLYYCTMAGRSGSGGKLPGEQRKRVPEQLVPRIAATSTLFYMA